MKVHPKNRLMPGLKHEHSLRMMSSQHRKLNLISHDCSTQFLLIEFSFKCHAVSHLSSSLLPPTPPKEEKNHKKLIIKGSLQSRTEMQRAALGGHKSEHRWADKHLE